MLRGRGLWTSLQVRSIKVDWGQTSTSSEGREDVMARDVFGCSEVGRRFEMTETRGTLKIFKVGFGERERGKRTNHMKKKTIGGKSGWKRPILNSLNIKNFCSFQIFLRKTYISRHSWPLLYIFYTQSFYLPCRGERGMWARSIVRSISNFDLQSNAPSTK